MPEDASVIVLVRPRRTLSTTYLARLWERVSLGSSLLIALDPQSYQSTTTEWAGSGLDKLLTDDQGISLYNGILIQPWFNNESFASLNATFSLGFVDPVPNPISEPAQRYDLPVALWGARPLGVEPFGVNSFAWAIADALPKYVETATNIFPSRTNPGAPLEINLDKDRLGQVRIAAFGENTVIGSRVAVFGDAEFVQNGYGLSLTPGKNTPRYPANTIMTERLAAWLLHVPEDQYPDLPSGLHLDRAGWQYHRLGNECAKRAHHIGQLG